MSDTVTLTKKQYEDLMDELRWLRCPESAGVSDWLGFDVAVKEFYGEVQ